MTAECYFPVQISHFWGDSDDGEDERPRKKSRSQSKTSIQPPSPAVEPLPCQQQTLSASQVHTPAWRGRRLDSGTLPCSATEAQILDLLEHLKKQMEQLEAKVNYLTSKLDATPQEMEVQIPVQLPLASVEEVNTFENWLKDAAHSQLKQKLISSLAAIGGHDAKRITWNILAHIFHDDVGKLINWKGVNGKKSFNQMSSKTLLLHSVRKNPIAFASTDHDICKHAIRWFNLAADRDCSRRRSGTQEVQPAD
ncbi:transcript variant X1 [Nothobranchius furzeri]|uniref:Transcript variant X1 n=1 Tax=Nothobranchius furzeri TaxID=105023 RepID=A0A9D2XZD6_NOTFU|nr:transcript variant X1 [Nothobranchius furzeri]